MSAAVIRLGALVGAMLVSACGGAAANAEWVHEPEPGDAIASEATLSNATLERASTDTETVSDSAPQSGPRRLDHTVTLGSVVATMPEPAPGAAPGQGPAITINVNNYVGSGSGYGYGYGGYVPLARGFGGGGSQPPVVSHHGGGGGGSMQPGQSWPAVHSYGPSFPYSTSPASPWETKH